MHATYVLHPQKKLQHCMDRMYICTIKSTKMCHHYSINKQRRSHQLFKHNTCRYTNLDLIIAK